MSIFLVIQGVLIGVVVAVPVGPLGLLCINRALAMGALCGLFSGLGVATADALAAGIAALGISFVSGFFTKHQMLLRLVGGSFLFYLGCKIFSTQPNRQQTVSNVNGLLNAYVTTFFLTFSNPVTILSFLAIYAGWHVPSLHGHYFDAGMLALGVFIGSTLWWIGLFIGVTACHGRFSMRGFAWVHRVSGALIVGFGIIVLLSLTRLKESLGIQF